MGRPTKLTPETEQTILKALELGATYEAAANAAGIAYNTFNEWMKEGEATKRGQKREFYEAVKKALGNRQARWLSFIEKAAQDGNWQAAAWKLERTEPENFGRQRLDIKHSGSIDVTQLSDDELQRIIKD